MCGIGKHPGACAALILALLLPAALAAQDDSQGAAPVARGDQQRRYFFEDAGVELPYRIYVPASYDPARPLPLVVALHGFGGNQDYFFDIVPDLPALLERHGLLFVAPMGFAADGWYGAPLDVPGDAPRSGGGPTPVPLRTPDEETRYRAFSEQDVMNVLGLVRNEYRVDPQRIYLLGHSMGGFGTWPCTCPSAARKTRNGWQRAAGRWSS